MEQYLQSIEERLCQRGRELADELVKASEISEDTVERFVNGYVIGYSDSYREEVKRIRLEKIAILVYVGALSFPEAIARHNLNACELANSLAKLCKDITSARTPSISLDVLDTM